MSELPPPTGPPDPRVWRITGTIEIRRRLGMGAVVLAVALPLVPWAVYRAVTDDQHHPSLDERLHDQAVEEAADNAAKAQWCDHASIATMLGTEYGHHNCIELDLGTDTEAWAIAEQIDRSLSGGQTNGE